MTPENKMEIRNLSMFILKTFDIWKTLFYIALRAFFIE